MSRGKKRLLRDTEANYELRGVIYVKVEFLEPQGGDASSMLLSIHLEGRI